MALSEKELRFCREYAANPNATEAYLRAFRDSSYVTARTRSYRLLQKPAIQAELTASRKAYAKRARVSAVKALKELAAIAHFDPDDVFEGDDACNDGLPVPRRWREIPPMARRAIAKIKIKRKRLSAGTRAKDDKTCWEIEEVDYQFHSKDAALDKLCKHLGLTKDGAALEELLAALASDREGSPSAVPPVGPGRGLGETDDGADETPLYDPRDDEPGPAPGPVPVPE